MEAVIAAAAAPVHNLRRLRRLVTFDDAHEQDVVWAIKDGSFELKHGEVLGVIEGGGLASIEQSSAEVGAQADSALKNAPAAAQPSAAAGSLAGNRGVAPQADADVDVDRDVDVNARAEVAVEPAPVQEQAPASPRAVGTSGSAEGQVARAEELPQTSSPLALSGLIGLLSLAGAFALRSIR